MFFNLCFWNQKHWCWTKNITAYQEKTKVRKRDLKEKTRQETKKDTGLMKKNFAVESFDVVSFHETKAKKTEKKREKKKEPKESKKERQEGRKKENNKRERERARERERERERQRKRNWTSGRPKKAQEKQRETLKNKQKMPLLGGKLVFCHSEAKKGNKKTTPPPKKTNKQKQPNKKIRRV